MKTIRLLILPLLIISSCGSFNNRYHYFEGAKDDEIENVALLAYDSWITMKAINGKKVNFNRTSGDKVIHLQAGEYIFTIRFRHYFSGAQQLGYTGDVDLGPYILEGGKHYTLSAFFGLGNTVFFNVRESPTPVNTGKRISLVL